MWRLTKLEILSRYARKLFVLAQTPGADIADLEVVADVAV
jgi:hypothetical protein